MRLDAPRVLPVPESEWTPEVREMLETSAGGGRVLNVFSTLARNPALMKSWLAFGQHVLMASKFPPRERELAILRIGWLCRSEYEWGQHAVIGKLCGLSAEEVARVKAGAETSGWSDDDRTVLRAADELHRESMITDATWTALTRRFNVEQLMDFVFTVGQYQLVCMALNTFGVQLDHGIPGFDDEGNK